MNEKHYGYLHLAANTLMFVGGLNWGLVGLLNLNLVTMLLGAWPGLERLVYVLVGAATLYVIATHKKDCRVCSEMMKKA